jgi:hypothetical protein
MSLFVSQLCIEVTGILEKKKTPYIILISYMSEIIEDTCICICCAQPLQQEMTKLNGSDTIC